MIFTKKFNSLFLLATAAFLAASGVANARPSIHFAIGGDEAIPANAIGIVVADRAGNGFQSLDHISVVGTELTPGKAIGLSDDLIVAVLRSGPEGFDSGNGFSDLAPNIPMAHWQINQGTDLAFYWFSGVSSRGQMLAANDDYSAFFTSAKLPEAKRDYHTIQLTSSANGGSTDVVAGSVSGSIGADDSNQGGNEFTKIPGTPFEGVDLTAVGFSDETRGRYVGLVQGPDGKIAGEFSASIGRKGASSFVVIINGRAHKLRGVFDAETGTFSSVVIRGVTYSFQLNISADGDYFISGSAVENGVAFLIGAVQRAMPGDFDGERIPGKYTMVLPADTEASTAILPGGNGYARISVSTSGSVKATFYLGDGTVATDGSYLGAGGSWQLFRPLYTRGGGGFIAGELKFRGEDNISDLDGPLHWNKQESAKDAAYPSGFEMAIHAVGSKYDAPWADELALSQLAAIGNNATFDWRYSDDARVQQPFTWARGNRLLSPTETHIGGPEPGMLAMKQVFSSRSGLVSGTTTIPSLSVPVPEGGRPKKAPTVRFRGVVLQKQGFVAGVVSRDGTTEDFVIEPVGGPDMTVTDSGGNALANGALVDFGDIGVDGGIGERVVKISNSGNANLYLSETPSITPEAYSLKVWRRGYIAPGESILIRVRVDPNAEGSTPGTLVFSSNDPSNNPFSFTLVTNGVVGSQSDIEAEAGGITSLTLPADFEAADFSDADFLAESDTGRYGGSVLGAGGGSASLLISKTGAFSGRITIGANYANVRGTIGGDGFGTATYFKGRLASTHQITGIELLENPNGANAILINLVSSEGDDSVLLQHQNFGKTNRTAKAGKYTFVLPNTEDLGAGFPSGDGAGVMSIDNYGLVRAKVRLADRQLRSLSGRLASDESWSFSQRWTYGILTGQVHLIESAEADFQGSASYQRLAHPRVSIFRRGFTMQNSILGSRFASEKGISILALEASLGNAEFNLAGDLANPITGKALNWTPNGRMAVETRVAGESIRLIVSRSSGWVTGFSSIQAEKTAFSGVVFQKQNLVTGSWGSGNKVGAFSIAPAVGSD